MGYTTHNSHPMISIYLRHQCTISVCLQNLLVPQSDGSFDCRNCPEPMHGMGCPSLREIYVQVKWMYLPVKEHGHGKAMGKPWGNLWKCSRIMVGSPDGQLLERLGKALTHQHWEISANLAMFGIVEVIHFWWYTRVN